MAPRASWCGMRLIGHLENEGLAERISRVMLAQGIHNLIEPDEGPRWAVWVHAEEDLERARKLFAAFRANPEDPAYRVRVRPADVPPPPTAPPSPRGGSDRPMPRGRRSGRVQRGADFPALTLAFVMMSVAVAILTGLSGRSDLVGSLQISELPWRWGRSGELFLAEVRRGEVWRLVTPVLLHFGWAHILFNMWVLWDLGSMVEMRRGSRSLLGLVLILGVASNLGQYFVSGPGFGGFSGVIYGLLGYVWMMGRYAPSAGMGLHPQTVVLMLVWFVICLSGALPFPVANMAHGVGLVAGVLWGRLEAARRGS